jgi:hypothetical protein
MATDAHPPAHAHDDHGDHGHGDGHEVTAIAWEIIPENSGVDSFLIVLAFACLLGLFAFSGLMVSSPLLHEHEKGAMSDEPAQEEMPSNQQPSGSQAH